MLTVRDAPQLPILPLRTLNLNCGWLERERDIRHLCDLVRCPIPTLESISMKFDCYGGAVPHHAPFLFRALTESTFAGHFELHFCYDGIEACFTSLVDFLPRLSNISSLAVHCHRDSFRRVREDEFEMKTALYRSALLKKVLRLCSWNHSVKVIGSSKTNFMAFAFVTRSRRLLRPCETVRWACVIYPRPWRTCGGSVRRLRYVSMSIMSNYSIPLCASGQGPCVVYSRTRLVEC